MNAQGRAMFKQTTAIMDSMNTQIESIARDIASVKSSCQVVPVVIPLPTTDTQTTH